MKLEQWEEVYETNLRSVFLLSKACLRGMVKNRAGRIINISSLVGTTGNPGQSNYASSKAGMVGFTKSLAREVANRGVTVNCVAPGFIATDMTDELTDEQKTHILASIPMGKLGRVEDIAKAVKFLASDDSAYITPDPISARINNKGARVGGIPSGLRVTNPGQYYYPIGDHAAEVFDGIAVGNSAYSNLEAFTKDHSEGSVTVLWKSGSTDVMEATFVHGSPYVYFKAYAGNLEVRTLRQDGVGEKGTFSTPSNMLGIWTNVAGAINNFLIVGEGSTSRLQNDTSLVAQILSTVSVSNPAQELFVSFPNSTCLVLLIASRAQAAANT